MKKISIIDLAFKVAVVIGLGVVIFNQFFDRDTIVYVDEIKLLNGYDGMTAAKGEFQKKSQDWQANVDTLRGELESKIQQFQSTQAGLSPKERTRGENLLKARQAEFLSYQSAVREKIQKEDREITARVLGKVNDYIKDYGKHHGYKIIMAATQYGNIVYAESGADITEEILAGLNRETASRP